MLVYGIMLGMTMAFTWWYDSKHRSLSLGHEKTQSVVRYTLFTLAWLPAVLISAVRFEVGTDYGEVYWLGYLGVVKHSEDPLIARNYVPICQFLNLFSRSPVLFFCLSSFLIIFSVFWYIRQTSEMITLPVLFFFIAGLFFDSLNVVRQYMAIAVWLFAYPFMRGRKPVPYLLISAIAILLHPSAAVLLPFYFLCEVRLKRRRILVSGLVLIVGCAMACWVLPKVLIYIPKYNSYADLSPDPELAGTVFAVMITAAVILLFKRLPENTHTYYLLWSLLMYDSVVFLSYFLPQMGRVMLYFEIPVFVNLVPKLLEVLPRPKRIMATGLTVALFLSSTIYMNYYLDHADVFPYHTIFEVENMEDYLREPGDVLILFRQDET